MSSASWLRSALSKAAEVGGKSFSPALGRTVRSYAGSVYQTAGHAVAGGAKLVQDRLSGKQYNNFKNAIKRLEEVAISAHGEERIKALRGWLTALKDIQNACTVEKEKEKEKEKGHEKKGKEEHVDESGATIDDGGAASRSAEGDDNPNISSMKAQTALFYDADVGNEPLNFRDVFLRSRALENLMVSFILVPPSEEEIELILQIFGLCLLGAPEVHKAIISGIQDLSSAAYGYVEEVKIAKKELLGIAQDCLTGLKMHAEAERIDAEIARVEHLMEERFAALGAKGGGGDTGSLVKMLPDSHRDGLNDQTFKEGTMNTEELLHLANSRQKLLERKAAFFNYDKSKGDHKMTVERLKGLSVTLKEAVREMKLKMEENRQQKHDALLYRSSKAAEVLEAEKVISAEVIALDKRRQALEAELKEVMAAITVATAKHIHIQEEKEQFDVASSNIVAHLAQQEEELAHRIMSHSVEESAVSMWQGFMQDTWALQLICTEERDKRTKDAAQKAMAEFLQIAAKHLKYRQEELTLLYKRLKFCSAELETMRVKSLHVEELGMDTVAANISSGKRRLEEKYLEAEALATKVFGVIESIRREATKYAATVQDGDGKAALETVQEYLASIDKLQAQIKDIDRPEINWEKEDENAKSGSETVSGTTSADKSVENSPAATPRGGGLLSGVLGSLAGSPRSRQEGRQLQSPRGDGDAAASSSHATEGSTAAAAGGADSDEQDDDSFKDVENDSEAGTELAKGHLGEDASTREEISGWEFDELGQEPDVPKAGGSKKDLGLIDKIWMGSSEELQVLPGGRSSK